MLNIYKGTISLNFVSQIFILLFHHKGATDGLCPCDLCWTKLQWCGFCAKTSAFSCHLSSCQSSLLMYH